MKKNINVKEIEINRGQIYGLPKNPRLIRDERFEALKKSIQDAPEMLDLRELIVYPHEGKYVIIGGNMRFRACQDLGYTEIPCKVLPEETPVAKLREYVIKDNEAFGQNDWGLLSEDWDKEELVDWGMETPVEWGEEDETEEVNDDDDAEEEHQRDPNSEIIISCVSLFGKTEDVMFVEEISIENTERIISLSKSKGINKFVTELLNHYEGV